MKHIVRFECSDEVLDRLSDLLGETHFTTLGDLLRWALACYDEMVEVKKAGGSVILRAADDSETELVVAPKESKA